MIRHQIRDIICIDLPRGFLVGVVVFALVYFATAKGAEPPAYCSTTPPDYMPAKQPCVASAERFTATNGITYEKCADGYYRAVSGAPAVASPKPFRTGDYNPSHRCNACGYQSPSGTGTWIVRGHNADGTHTHSCPQCGNSWRH